MLEHSDLIVPTTIVVSNKKYQRQQLDSPECASCAFHKDDAGCIEARMQIRCCEVDWHSNEDTDHKYFVFVKA